MALKDRTGSPPRGGAEGCGMRGGRVEVVDRGMRLAPGVSRWLEERATEALAVLGAGGEVRVRAVGDAEMAAAHEKYSGVPGTTDVLTFDLGESDGGLDTDILVCVDEAGRQSGVRGHTVEQELLLYVVHGVLHCLGHDDHDPDAAARMHAEEDRVLAAVGVGVTYARGAGGAA